MSDGLPSVTEMGVVVHWANPIPDIGRVLFEFRESIKSEYPKVQTGARVEIPDPNAPVTIQFVAGMPISEPRFLFGSEDDAFVVQLQNDMFGFNWRKRTPLGDPPGVEYPGFDSMLAKCEQVIRHFASVTDGLSIHIPEIRQAGLFYNNAWALNSEPSPIGKVFKFWNTMGLENPVLGPEVKFASLFELEPGNFGRVEVLAAMGVILNPQVGRHAAQLQFNGNVNVGSLDWSGALKITHNHISKLYDHIVAIGRD